MTSKHKKIEPGRNTMAKVAAAELCDRYPRPDRRKEMTAPERVWARPDYNECWPKRLEEEDTEYTRSDLIPTAAYVAGLESALRGCLTAIDHADMKDGVCCCGDDMLYHESPMNCGHSPRDMGEYHAAMVVAAAEKALSARPDAPDVRVVTVAQLDRWLGCLVSLEIKDEIHTIIGDVK